MDMVERSLRLVQIAAGFGLLGTFVADLLRTDQWATSIAFAIVGGLLAALNPQSQP